MNMKRNTLSLAALLAGVSVASAPALATPSLPFVVNCKIMNATNIGITADANGYTSIDPFPTGGVYTMTTADISVPLPANGIICLKSFTGNVSSYYKLKFQRNSGNTPVYLLVEDFIQMNYTYISVSGEDATAFPAAGLTIRGGLGGPAGSDGGSCDYGVTTSKRSGEGLGPGGGKASNVTYVGGGGGAGPTRNGTNGYHQTLGTGAGAAGGVALSSFDHRIIHGGSGGGCGDMAGVAYGGGGGGGVLVVLAGNRIHTGVNNNAGFYAQGGSSMSGGGGGGGGLVRLIAPKIEGEGLLDVRGSAAYMNYGAYTTIPRCNNTSYYGGCGGNGLVKLEGYDVAGTFVTYSTTANGRDSIKFGAPQTPVLPTTDIPTVEVINVRATFDGTVQDQVPPTVDFTSHPYTHPGMYFRSGQVLTVTVRTKHVPSSAAVKVRMNAMDPANVASLVATAGTPVAGVAGSHLYTWTATLTVPTDSKIGSIEAWVASVCTPGTTGCAAVN